MAIARTAVIDPQRAGCFHLISRCVRRAFLCGDKAEHRKTWLLTALHAQTDAFAIEVLAFAIMDNHLHLVVRTDPLAAALWSDRDVVSRWASLFPERGDVGQPAEWPEERFQAALRNPVWVCERRHRLSSVSWYMKLLKERLARRANREDNCTGHFWEGRFQAVPLLDQAALIACMAYVDLNPIRAGIAHTPEASDHTSIQARIRARQTFHRASALDQVAPGRLERPASPEAGLWLQSLGRCICGRPGDPNAPVPLSLDDYLHLVDATGRIVKTGKRGAIPAHLKPILSRLRIAADRWVDVMFRRHGFRGTGIGSAVCRAAEALRRGVKWIADKVGLHNPVERCDCLVT